MLQSERLKLISLHIGTLSQYGINKKLALSIPESSNFDPMISYPRYRAIPHSFPRFTFKTRDSQCATIDPVAASSEYPTGGKMNQSSDSFYITTPIYYVNDRPHIGHIYTTTLADVAARFQRFMGRPTFFLTGTDEHGLKVEQSASAAGITPQEQADINAEHFLTVFNELKMSNDDFLRTTQPRHEKQVQTFVKQLIEKGDVYLGQYEGWYDLGQEEYIPENKAKDLDYKSPISGKPLVRQKETNYFFKLSAYQKRLEELYEKQPQFVRPQPRRNEMLGRFREGLQDVPMTRTSFKWGIPIPDDPEHVIYVWVDALFNYITAIGLADDSLPEAKRKHFWPAQYHIIGKEILFFHSVLWPAMLMALEIPLPNCIYAHSFWIREGRKMSKSLGNFIEVDTIREYIEQFGLDALRWYLVTQGPLGATDADFADAKFKEVYNTDLANTFGNSASRVTNMITKYFDSTVPDPGDQQFDEQWNWPRITADACDDIITKLDNLDLAHGLIATMDLIRKVDAYIDATRPFTLAKSDDPADPKQLAAILYNCAETLRIASLFLHCALPWKIETFWKSLGLSINPNENHIPTLKKWGTIKPNSTITKIKPLFPRYQADNNKK